MTLAVEKVQVTSQVKQIYANLIGILFNGAVTATPDQISNQVITDVDAMMIAIAKCSQPFKEATFKVIYNVIIGKFVGKFVESIVENFILREHIEGKIEDLIQDWVLSLVKDYQFRPCVDGARLNWRSPIEIDLLGI